MWESAQRADLLAYVADEWGLITTRRTTGQHQFGKKYSPFGKKYLSFLEH